MNPFATVTRHWTLRSALPLRCLRKHPLIVASYDVVLNHDVTGRLQEDALLVGTDHTKATHKRTSSSSALNQDSIILAIRIDRHCTIRQQSHRLLHGHLACVRASTNLDRVPGL